MQNNNQEAEFRDWVSKANYQSLVKAFNNSCCEKRTIIAEEISRRFEIPDPVKFQDKLDSILNSTEWAETHTYLQNLCRKLGYSKKDVEGDSYFTPDIIDLADMIFAKTPEGIKERLDRERALNELAEETRQLKLFDMPKISPESEKRRINRKLP